MSLFSFRPPFPFVSFSFVFLFLLFSECVDLLPYIWAIGCIFAELLTTKPLFPGKEKDPKNPALFQDDQVDKIFRIMGKPTQASWPDIVYLPEWKKISEWDG
jgi:serine/threonine protein kinase